MNEDVELEINLASEWFKNPPSFEVYIDDFLIQNGTVSEKHKENSLKKISWVGSLSEGDHYIKIKLLNKTNMETVIDSKTQEILKDQLLYIESISIDQIDIGFLSYRLGKFYPNKEIRPDLDDVIPHLTCIGYNGEWQLKFSVPTYLWLLENF